MKNFFLITALALSLLTTGQFACADVVTIATWTFETSIPSATGQSISGLAAEVGTGTASGFHTSNSTVWSNPVGNGSAESLSSNNWAIGDYVQFSVSTLGLQNLNIEWDQASSSTGPGEFKLAYRVGAGSFVNYQDYTVRPNQNDAPGLGNWTSAGPRIAGYGFSVDLSSVSALNNASSVDFRFVMRSSNDATPPGTVQTSGSSRFDNVTIKASAVPEPTSAGLLALTGVAGLAFRRRRS